MLTPATAKGYSHKARSPSCFRRRSWKDFWMKRVLIVTENTWQVEERIYLHCQKRRLLAKKTCNILAVDFSSKLKQNQITLLFFSFFLISRTKSHLFQHANQVEYSSKSECSTIYDMEYGSNLFIKEQYCYVYMGFSECFFTCIHYIIASNKFNLVEDMAILFQKRA